MSCSYSYLQEIFYKRFDSITVVLKESDSKVAGSSPIKKLFFIFYFFAFAKMQVIFVIYMFVEKNMF